MFNFRCILLPFRDLPHSLSTRGLKQTINRIKPEYDTDYLTNPANIDHIKKNILNRKGVGDIERVHGLVYELNHNTDTTIRVKLQQQLEAALKTIPNHTHPDVVNYGDGPKEIASIGLKRNFTFSARPFDGLCGHLNILRTNEIDHFNGSRSYYFMNELAEMEEALIQYTVDKLDANGFELISVPEILPPEVIEGCGMKTTGERHQVFKTLPDNLCLSGTSEMALGGFFAGKRFHIDELPIRVMAVSRCHRAETSTAKEDKGVIFRVHSFSKVEMFSVCAPDQSESMLDEFKRIEIDLFSKLNLHFTVLDMPPCELGAPAYRKFDIEAWMPGRGMYGEISSCSNCTDYQARRLDIRFSDRNGQIVHAHTVNGTGCAVPRMLMAIAENGQNEDFTINIPTELQRYMDGKSIIQSARVLPGSKRAQIDETNVESSA
ncbi:serine--tRNA ligase, mitochondrial-like [Bradysia coprophila]|uniref:serine--tRNA ligase, mitochondrial-like n=1 Tax=Bradysia coprophila TaxID=38358 RepID=UPI00187D84ED|nr:serine--tRNA ligase, mitochondrial-like [Bradysia coprophila]